MFLFDSEYQKERLLSRLQRDCIYFLTSRDRDEKFLYTGNVKKQVAEMRRIYNELEVKPYWTSMAQIDELAQEMEA